jgi:hypothetical protein
VLGFLGTLNPTSGDVSVFLPLEQALLASSAVAGPSTTSLFARYNVIGMFAGALGALAAGVPELGAKHLGLETATTERSAFMVYAATGGVVAWIYHSLPEQYEVQS